MNRKIDLRLLTFKVLGKIAAFMHRHKEAFIDAITYTSILTYIPLDYFIFTPYNWKFYYAILLILIVFTVSYILMRILLDLFIYVCFLYRNP